MPDWSTDVNIYLLTWRKSDEVDGKVKREESEVRQEDTFVFEGGGSNFLFVKGSIVGTICTFSCSDADSQCFSCTKREEMENDFSELTSRLTAALNLAREPVMSYYLTRNSLEEAFIAL